MERARAERLLETPRALSACLACLDDALDDPAGLADEHVSAMRHMRALVLAFLGADGLAMADLAALGDGAPALRQRRVAPLAFVASAGDWHRARRQAMLRRYPGLAQLYKRDHGDVVAMSALLLALVALHLVVASGVAGPLHALAAAATVGAVCAYGFQALTHELGHLDRGSPLGVLAGLLASSLLNFPFAMYYWHYHARHHAHTGASRDRDGDILFLAWHSPPPRLRESPAGRWLWLSAFALAIYPMFRRAKAELDSPHEAALRFEGAMLLAHGAVLALMGPWALLYVELSCAFALGACGHPYGHFWLTQHAFALQRKRVPAPLRRLADTYHVKLCQPTLSYTGGSALWHWLNFGELRHVEHHDWPLVPFWRMPAARALAVEFYKHLNGTESHREALAGWLFTPSDREWIKGVGDFAGRTRHLVELWKRSDDFAVQGCDDNGGRSDDEANS